MHILLATSTHLQRTRDFTFISFWLKTTSFLLIFFLTKVVFFFFFLAFYSSWLFGSRWPMFPGGTAHSLLHGWPAWPSGLGHLPPFLPVPWWCVEGRAEVFRCPSVYPPSAATAGGVGGRGRVFALPSWACAPSVPGTGVVISWEHGRHALSVWLVSIFLLNIKIVL